MNRAVVLLLAGATSAAMATSPVRSVQTPVFTGRAELTVLNVVVTDQSGRYVGNLPRDAFTVFEDGRAQPISLFTSIDAPATIGLIVDGSASMHGMRDLVSESAGAFVATRTAEDEIFALTFTERARPVLPPDAPFTSDSASIEALLRAGIGARGRTALYDAIADGLTYLVQGHRTRKVLVVVSDGDDNVSRTTYEQLTRAVTTSNTVIYGIGIVDPVAPDQKLDRLNALAALTGGTAHLPRSRGDVRHAFARIADDIRSSYTVGYVPPSRGPVVRQIRVTVQAPGGRLTARTRREYVGPGE